MKKIILVTLIVGTVGTYAQKSTTFSKLFGGDEDDVAKAVVKTDDGFLIAGKTKSFTDHRDFDAYLIKIDANGKKIWSRVYGGEDDEEANDVVRFGNGYAFVGSTETYGNERMSFYMVRVDEAGEPVWQSAYYRDEDDEYYGTSLIADGNELVFAGYERHLQFFGEKLNPYVFKIDANGDKLWGGYFGGKEEDRARDIIKIDGGYIIVGDTESLGDNDPDMYMAKISSSGKREWFTGFGGDDDDIAHAVVETGDGYLLAGSTDSFGRNYKSVYVVRTDKDGKKIWSNIYGGTREDEAFGVTRSTDGGFVIVGRTESFTRRNGFDLYLLKIDGKGKVLWERTYGGESDDAGYDVLALSDGYLVVGEKKTDRRRDSDVWILKVDLNGRL